MKTQFPAAEALAVAQSLFDRLTNVCERVRICGSLRRGCATVGDIELLFVPRTETRAVDMFNTIEADLAEPEINRLVEDGTLRKRTRQRPASLPISPSPSLPVSPISWGPLNKYAVHAASGIPVDFFSTTLAAWWVSLVVRTGSKANNLRLTTGAQKLGRKLLSYGEGIRDLASWKLLPATSEEDVFRLCGVPYLNPTER